MKKVDLHLHTFASDGEWSPEQVVKELDDNNISIFAVTDHDAMDCLGPMTLLMKDRPDLTFIKGLEGTVTYRGVEHHILTYGVDENNQELEEMLSINRQVRTEYNSALMTWLNESYPELSAEGFMDYDYDPYQAGWKAFGYVRSKGLVETLSDYQKLTRGFKRDKQFLDPVLFFSKMAEYGYKTVLAHPAAYAEGDLYDVAHLDYFRDLGLCGIECYSNYFADLSNAKYYIDYCNKYDLMITGGSDCHGGWVGRHIGRPHVDESMIRL